jgi:hypothetical protein
MATITVDHQKLIRQGLVDLYDEAKEFLKSHENLPPLSEQIISECQEDMARIKELIDLFDAKTNLTIVKV